MSDQDDEVSPIEEIRLLPPTDFRLLPARRMLERTILKYATTSVVLITLLKGTGPFSRLSGLIGWIPSSRLRKKAKKLIADQALHIAELLAHGQVRAARWQRICTWGIFFWMVLLSPIESFFRAVRPSKPS